MASSWNSEHTVMSTARLSLGSLSLGLLSPWPWGPGKADARLVSEHSVLPLMLALTSQGHGESQVWMVMESFKGLASTRCSCFPF